MATLDYFIDKYHLTIGKKMPINIPNIGRNDLAKDFKELGFEIGVEIGTEAGKYAHTICSANPFIKLYCVDPWTDYEDGHGYKDKVDQKGFDNYYQIAQKRLAPFKNCELIRDYSMKAVRMFADNSLDFVYIDGNHRLDYVVNDLVWWTEKVRPGGIVAGHDYIKLRKQCYSHIPYAIGAYTAAYNIRPWFVMDQKHPNKSEELNSRMDRIRSWFFVKV